MLHGHVAGDLREAGDGRQSEVHAKSVVAGMPCSRPRSMSRAMRSCPPSPPLPNSRLRMSLMAIRSSALETPSASPLSTAPISDEVCPVSGSTIAGWVKKIRIEEVFG